MADIRLEKVRKVFDRKVVAVNDVSLTVRDQEFVVLLGPSGCGKTTLLRCVAGLEQVDAGRIFIGEREVTHLPPRKRNIAMVFQNYAVFPHLTVFENIAFGLRMQRRSREEIERRVREAAALLHIADLLERYPSQLSGGQRQRVAVARAIAVHPEVLLMDEPLSNLDALLRLEMRAELKRLLRDIRATTIYVTHDQVEALSMGDRIAVMREGRILQYGSPLEVYDYPASVFVGGFIGNPPMNFLHATLVQEDHTFWARTPGGRLPVPEPVARTLQDRRRERVIVGIRAENMAPQMGSPTQDPTLQGTVLVVEPLGSHNLITLQMGDALVKITTPADFRPQPGQGLQVQVRPEKLRWFDPETEEAIAVDRKA